MQGMPVDVANSSCKWCLCFASQIFPEHCEQLREQLQNGSVLAERAWGGLAQV